jgi:hypothetical protein
MIFSTVGIYIVGRMALSYSPHWSYINDMENGNRVAPVLHARRRRRRTILTHINAQPFLLPQMLKRLSTRRSKASFYINILPRNSTTRRVLPPLDTRTTVICNTIFIVCVFKIRSQNKSLLGLALHQLPSTAPIIGPYINIVLAAGD